MDNRRSGQVPRNPVIPQANGIKGIPRYVQLTSPVSNAPQTPSADASRATTLPLNLIALIIAYLDDIADIARVTRTCRLLYYMTLPQLYEHVSLHSCSEIRYVNGKPEGFGGGSPLISGLNGLVTKNHAALVKGFRIWGAWKEHGQEDYAKGRVPDNSMMLNILLRVVVDKMPKLESFRWELDCKPFKTLYQGLAARTTLTTLSLKFPSSRIPRPATLIPPMPNLRAFKVTDIDPVCCPDDFSLLLLESKRLEDLRLHFSPRLRANAESVMTLGTFFWRCHRAQYKLKLKHFGIQNFFGPNVYEDDVMFDIDTCRSITLLNAMDEHGNDPRTVFVDDTWRIPPLNTANKMQIVRATAPSKMHVTFMQRAMSGMERLYFVSPNCESSSTPSANHSVGSPEKRTPSTASSSLDSACHESKPQQWSSEVVSLCEEIFHVLTRKHGPTVRHLLLHAAWGLQTDDISDLFRYCPNIEQLGFAMGTSDHQALRLLVPFMRKLRVLRILTNEFITEHLASMSHEERMQDMGRDIARTDGIMVEYIGLGDVIYKRGPVVLDTGPDGSLIPRAEISIVPFEEVAHIEIWKMDCLSLDVDPMAAFDR